MPSSSVIRVRTAWHATHMTTRTDPPPTPVIIEVALNGVTSRRRNPNVPATVEEHAKDALACIDAGATIIHTHAPNLVVGAEEAAEQYATAFRPVVEQHPGIICYPTVGFGDTIEDRYRHVELLDDMGLVRQGAVDTGSVNLGGTGPDGLPPASEFVYTNTFAEDRLRDAGVHRRAGSVRASRSSSPASCRSCSRTRGTARCRRARS